MKYTELVEIGQGFQASINLEYDLNKIKKIRSYIPTEQSVRVLGEFLRSYYFKTEPQNRASVLIGPYGRGKSHLLLVLSALTSLDLRAHNYKERQRAQEVQEELCAKIEKVNREVGALARAVVQSKIRTLPVIINSNSVDINQAFLIAINEALTQANLQKLLPTTYFDAAIAVIDKWEANFPEAYAKLKAYLKARKSTVEDLRIGLKQFKQESYRVFCDSYPSIAAGSEFNPLTNMDVVKLYMAVSNALFEQTQYKGITVIFDEFSKFLEANLDKSKMLNFKIIQDMAEAATRSGDAQLHFTCITHKDILDYSSSDSFKTVEGRFKKIHFVASSEQSYELIANAIIKKESFGEFRREHNKDFQHVADVSARTSLFTDISPQSYEEKLVSGCFPLSPLSAYALLHVSELVGQNERTLFTFLAQSGAYTFRKFINGEFKNPTWITVDYIYGYFEELFKKEVFNTNIHSIWSKTDSALRQVTDKTQQRVLKGIAVINILGDERFKAVPAHLKAALLMNDEEFEYSVRELLKKHILSQRDSSEFVLLTANGVDVQRSVDKYVKTYLSKINACEVLNRACKLGFVMPRQYNDKYSMLRCFKHIYMDAEAFMLCKNGNQILENYPYDGVIVNIVNLTDLHTEKIKEKVREFSTTPQIVVCITEHPFIYENLLKQYEAVCKLLATNDDPHFLEELEVFGEDIQKRIVNMVRMLYAPSSEYSSFWNCNGELTVSKQVELNHEISAICSKCYNWTPVVNNEMVNKSVLNAQNTKARDAVIDWILQHSEDSVIPCIEGTGPDASIFKSAFKRTGLDVATTVGDEGMNRALDEIKSFIQTSESKKNNFLGLYQKLMSAPYGMRKGIIPLYIAYVMRPYKENLILYFKGHEVELSATMLSNLNDVPENYEIMIETGTAEKNLYIEELQKLFEQYFDIRTPSINKVYSIVKGMQNWIRALPEYTKKFKRYLDNGEIKQVEKSVDVIRKELLQFDINSRELLLGTWIDKLSAHKDPQECYEVILSTKNFLDSHMRVFRNELKKKITAMVVPGYLGGLSRAIMTWYQKLPDSTKTHVFDADSNALLITASTISSYNDDELLDTLVSIYASIEIEDWNDTLAENFEHSLSTSVNLINNFSELKNDETEEGRLQLMVNGVKVEKTFTCDDISPLGKTALNNLMSVFEEYNDSLEPDEQLAILAQLIGNVIH